MPFRLKLWLTYTYWRDRLSLSLSLTFACWRRFHLPLDLDWITCQRTIDWVSHIFNRRMISFVQQCLLALGPYLNRCWKFHHYVDQVHLKMDRHHLTQQIHLSSKSAMVSLNRSSDLWTFEPLKFPLSYHELVCELRFFRELFSLPEALLESESSNCSL